MASTQGIRAGRAFVELFVNDSKLVRGLRAAEKKLKAFGDTIRSLGLKLVGIGSAMLAPLAASAKLFGSYGDSVAKMARRTGLSVEALSELRFAAGQSGVEVSELENGLRRMQRTIYDASRGLSTAGDALTDLGLTTDDLAERSPEQQFKILAERISRIEDPTLKAALAMTVFGRSGTQLLPLFASGAKGIETLQAEARRLGLTMSGEDAQAAEDFTDTLDRLWSVVRMGVFHIGSALAPTLMELADQIMRVAMVISAWIKQNRQIIITVLKVATAIVAVGMVITLLGTIISGLGVAMGALVTVVTSVTAAINMLAAAIISLISPIGATIAAVVALGVYLATSTQAGVKAIEWLGEKFNVLRDDAVSAFGGIADALAAGDISLAAKILWLTLKMEWTRGVNALTRVWTGFTDFLAVDGFDALLVGAENVWHALEAGWIETTAFFSDLWAGFTDFFAKSWEMIKADAQKAWNWIKSLFDESFDLQSENKTVDDQKQAAVARLEDDRKRQAAHRENQRNAERQIADAVHQASLGEIGRANLAKHQSLDSEYAQRMAENQADLDKARQEWRDAVAAAKDQRREKEATTPAGLEGPDDIIKKAREALAGLGDIGDLMQQEANKVGVRGTFNAAAVQGLAAGNAADRTAKASEETAKNTKRLVQAAQTGGLVFA